MTLVLSLGNSDYVVQLADRRVSVGNAPVDEESPKCGVLYSGDGRFAFGFTGLSSNGSFRTRDWLLDTLFECGAPDYASLGIVQRLTENANRTFAEHPSIRSLAAPDKRLTVMFTGYLDHHGPPLLANAIITNFQDFTSGRDDHQAWLEFKLQTWAETRPNAGRITFVQRVGVWPAMTRADERTLRQMLADQKPSAALVGKGVALLREMSDRPAAQRRIGRQISSICIPRNQAEGVRSAYHTAHLSAVAFMADTVIVRPGERAAFRDVQLKAVSSPSNKPVAAVPQVRRNRPCPCGSGRRYKHCHGRWPTKEPPRARWRA